MKETTYKRLKRENKELQYRIDLLVKHINLENQNRHVIGIILPLKLANNIRESVEKLVWSGESTI